MLKKFIDVMLYLLTLLVRVLQLTVAKYSHIPETLVDSCEMLAVFR